MPVLDFSNTEEPCTAGKVPFPGKNSRGFAFLEDSQIGSTLQGKGRLGLKGG